MAKVIIMNENCNWCNLTEKEKKYLLFEGNCWNVYLADKQDYIGRCILVLDRHCKSISQLNDAEWLELKVLINKLEASITSALGATMFNWSCLMNDFYKSDVPNPHLHIHLRPRYKNPIIISGKKHFDEEFAHHYNNHKRNVLTVQEAEEIFNLIKNKLSEEQ